MPRMKNTKGCEGKALIKFRGDIFTKTMCDITPEYKKCVIMETGEKVLYVQVLRLIYGCVEASLLSYVKILRKSWDLS